MHLTNPTAASLFLAQPTGVARPMERMHDFVTGYGALLQQEHELRRNTLAEIDDVARPASPACDELLRTQESRLDVNITLLEQRYETLPKADRFHSVDDRPAARTSVRSAIRGRKRRGRLPDLVRRHLTALRALETLIQHSLIGQRAELILTAVAQSHEEMASALMVEIKRDHVGDRDFHQIVASAPSVAAAMAWENEGGACPAAPAPNFTAQSAA
jgi:hypothetical protein